MSSQEKRKALFLLCSMSTVPPPEDFDPRVAIKSFSDEEVTQLYYLQGPPFSLELAERRGLIDGTWSWERDTDGCIRHFSFRPKTPAPSVTMRYILDLPTASLDGKEK